MEPQNDDSKAAVAPHAEKRMGIEDLIVRSKLDTEAAIRLLESWRIDGDEQDQRETWEILKKMLEEDPVSI
jgi:hypothetical protein